MLHTTLNMVTVLEALTVHTAAIVLPEEEEPESGRDPSITITLS